MGNIFKQKISNFSGGVLEDKRISSPTHFSITKHFDAMTYPTKLIPYAKRETANGLSGGVVTTLKLTRFLYARTTTASTFRLFALGDDGSGKIKIFKLDIDGSSNLDNENFVAATNGTSGSGARSETVFFYYKTFIYMYQGSSSIARFDVAESAGFADSWQTIDDSTIGVRPVLHPNDDIAYFFGAQNVYTLNNTSWTANVLTIPSDLKIVAACPYGNYLAIGCTTLGNLDKHSVIYLWDRDSSLTTLSERIDLGECDLKHLATLNNKLIAVTSTYLTNAYSLSKGKIQIKTPDGNSFITLSEITTDTVMTASDLPITNFVRDNKLYFPMKATLSGDTRVGIWVVDQFGHITLDTIEPALDTHANASAIRGIYATANLWWISYDDGAGGAGSYSVTRTDDDGAYDIVNASIYESLILNTIHVTNRGQVIGDSSVKKILRGVTVMTEPLPSTGQVVMKYRRNVRLADGSILAETSWTTIMTHSTDNDIVHEAVNIESSSAPLPEYSEIQLRLESTGGAQITGFEYSAETKDDAPFE